MLDVHSIEYWDRKVESWQRTLADIRALPCTCAHERASGQLQRTRQPGRYVRLVVCDECGTELQALEPVTS